MVGLSKSNKTFHLNSFNDAVSMLTNPLTINDFLGI